MKEINGNAKWWWMFEMGLGGNLDGVKTEEELRRIFADRMTNFGRYVGNLHFFFLDYSPDSFDRMTKAVPLTPELLGDFYSNWVREVTFFRGRKEMKNGKGQAYLVDVYSEETRGDFLGFRIEIDNRQSFDNQCMALVHEAVHAIYGIGGDTSPEEYWERESLVEKVTEEFYYADHEFVEDLALRFKKDERQGVLFVA